MDGPMFTRDGSDVVCKVDGPLGLVFSLRFEAGTEWAASLLADHFISAFKKHIEAVRRLEYEAGWRDAKTKKRPKRAWFWSTLRKDLP